MLEVIYDAGVPRTLLHCLSLFSPAPRPNLDDSLSGNGRALHACIAVICFTGKRQQRLESQPRCDMKALDDLVLMTCSLEHVLSACVLMPSPALRMYDRCTGMQIYRCGNTSWREWACWWSESTRCGLAIFSMRGQTCEGHRDRSTQDRRRFELLCVSGPQKEPPESVGKFGCVRVLVHADAYAHA